MPINTSEFWHMPLPPNTEDTPSYPGSMGRKEEGVLAEESAHFGFSHGMPSAGTFSLTSYNMAFNLSLKMQDGLKSPQRIVGGEEH